VRVSSVLLGDELTHPMIQFARVRGTPELSWWQWHTALTVEPVLQTEARTPGYRFRLGSVNVGLHSRKGIQL
jgi:hypothetical protein